MRRAFKPVTVGTGEETQGHLKILNSVRHFTFSLALLVWTCGVTAASALEVQRSLCHVVGISILLFPLRVCTVSIGTRGGIGRPYIPALFCLFCFGPMLGYTLVVVGLLIPLMM